MVSIDTSTPLKSLKLLLLVDPEPSGMKISFCGVCIIVWVSFWITVCVVTFCEGLLLAFGVAVAAGVGGACVDG